MEKAHSSRYSIYPGTKIYKDWHKIYLFNGIKKEISNFVARCTNCRQVKVEHQGPRGLTLIVNVPTWKWKDVNIYFVVVLPHNRK